MMVIVSNFPGEIPQERMQQMQQLKGRVYLLRPTPFTIRLAYSFDGGIRWMIGNVEPKSDAFTQPKRGIGDEQSLPPEEMIRSHHLSNRYHKRPRIHNPQIPTIIMPRCKLLLHLRIENKERKRLFRPHLQRRMGITFQLAVFVMTPMLRRPPDRPSLIGGTPQ